MIRKIQSIHPYHFHACSNNLNLLFRTNQMNGIWIITYVVWIWTFGSKQLHLIWLLAALGQITSYCHVTFMQHIVALHWLCYLLFVGICSLSVDVVPTLWSLTPMKSYYYLQKCQASKTPLFILVQSHSLAPPLFYCIRTTTIQLLHAAVVEPLSFAWPVICHSK